MQDLKGYIKDKSNGVIYAEDIKNLVLMLKDKYGLSNYINHNFPVDINFDDMKTNYKFQAPSLENAIDYDEINGLLIFDMSVLSSKMAPLYTEEDATFNWIMLTYEILYSFEDINLYKYKNERIKNPVTHIIDAYDEFINESRIIQYLPEVYNYKNNNKPTSTIDVINPFERIKKLHAYFNTLDTIKGINLNENAINRFKKIFEFELLKGYSVNDQNTYPLKTTFMQGSYLDGHTFMMRKFKWYNSEAMVAISNASREIPSIKERIALGYPIDSVDYTLVRRNKI